MLNNDILKTFWNQLCGVSTFDFFSTCRKFPSSYEVRKGKGVVLIESLENERITFFEKGKWKGEGDLEIAFTNVFRWKLNLDKGSISLEHLRFGVNHPVYLFDLIPLKEGFLKSAQPHECKEDSYLGSVLFNEKQIQFDWQILGPQKNELVRLIYL